MLNMEGGLCPRCGAHAMMQPAAINALSRTTRGRSDEPMWVCSDCGTDEGLEDFFNEEGATPQSEWPVEEFSFPEVIDHMRVAHAARSWVQE